MLFSNQFLKTIEKKKPIDILTGISLKIGQENPFSTHISVHLLSPANTIIYFKAGYWENHYL